MPNTDAVAPSPFRVRPLHPVSWWRRLFGLLQPSNAAIEVENALAGPSPTAATLTAALRPYRMSAADVRTLFGERFKQALVHCLADDLLSDAEVTYLAELRQILALSDMELGVIEAKTIHPRYEKAVAAVLADAHVTEEERKGLRQLEERLRLPEAIRKRIYGGQAQEALQQQLDRSVADRRLSPEEEADLKAMADNLDLEISVTGATSAVLDRFRLLWRIENGDIPAIEVPIHLAKGEKCYHAAQVEWHELRTVTRRVSYAGPTVSIPIVKGVRFRMGSFAPSVQRAETLTPIDSGTLYITDRRILFDGSKRNLTVRLNKLTSLQVYSDAIVLEKDTGRSPHLFMADVEMAATILSAAMSGAR